MPLNCPQREDNLRLPPSGGDNRQPPVRKRKALAVVVLVVLLAVLLAAGYWWQQASTSNSEFTASSTVAGDQHSARNEPDTLPTQTEAKAPPAFCERDFSTPDKRRQAIPKLAAAGGLVHLLKREQATPPFTCAALYLSQGLDVNAADTGGVTALHYAIYANAPKMLQFVIDHGADLHQKAGEKQLEPMAYAYYLALNDRSTDRNPIIEILNTALEDSEDEDRTP